MVRGLCGRRKVGLQRALCEDRFERDRNARQSARNRASLLDFDRNPLEIVLADARDLRADQQVTAGDARSRIEGDRCGDLQALRGSAEVGEGIAIAIE